MNPILIEKEEALRRYNQMVNIRFPAITAFLLAVLFLKIFLKVPFPNPLFFFTSLMLISTIFYDFFFRKIKEPKVSQIVNGYFGYRLFDLVILTIIIYLIGGALWIGFIFYSFYIYIGFLLFPRIYNLFYIFYCSFLYTLLIIVQYLGIFPSFSIFSLEERVPQNLSYLASTWLAAVIFLWVLGYFGDTFYKILQEKILALQKTRQRLEEERMSLEIRVKARTRQLSEEREALKEMVKERTKELEKERRELASKIEELERFYRLAVGRELKMVELKKEIEKLKKLKVKS